jgi:hypothetical protein
MKNQYPFFSKNTKQFLIGSVLLSYALNINAQKITIIESLSGNAWAVQDTVWRFVAKGMGYTATIVPQSTLDTILDLDSTDALIVASSNVSFIHTNHMNTIKKFVLSGRPAYIQSEYISNWQGNVTFDTLMHSVGADFRWTGTTNGQLVPMNVLGTFATTPNTVSTLDYFNYGQSGTGTGVQKFLEYGGSYYGFCYSDTAGINGTVITISDEDWIWQNKSPLLMQNIISRLLNVNSTPNAVQDIVAGEVSVYPNPFSNNLTFYLNSMEPAELTIYSITSRKVEQRTFTNSIQLNTDPYEKGIYIFSIKSKNGLVNNGKIVKQ